MNDLSTSALVGRIAALKGAKTLVIGDVMLDRFVYGEVDRISPEAPVPVVRVRDERAMLGGAGNVVRNLVALTAQVHFLAVVGDDAAGREIGGLIAAEAWVDPDLVVEGGRQTTIKTRFSAGSHQMLRVDRETSAPIGDRARERIQTAAQAAIPHAGAISLSDYNKGVLSPALLQVLIAQAIAAGKPIVVDPKGSDYAIYRGATLVTPNRRELHEATRLPVETDQQIVAAARALIETAGIANVLVTRSQDGMSLILGTGEVFHMPAEAREVYDVSGAGDTVVAVMTACLAAGAPLHEAAQLANVAAGIVVGRIGTASATADDIVAALHHSELAVGEAKVATVEGAVHQVELWRRLGLKVGFTNGCFDLLHPGHVSLVQQARGKCDRLIVAINSDDSVRRQEKGPNRPVQHEAARATVLASLAAVDLVVIFDEDTPLEVINRLRPDLLVKGADYDLEAKPGTKGYVVGSQEVRGWGGQVTLAEFLPGHSTTRTIAKLGIGSK